MPAKPVLGLYFTDSFIEIAQVSSDRSRLDLYGSSFLPQGLVINGEIKNTDEFKNELRKLLATTKPRSIRYGEKVVIGVSDNRVFLREFSLPKYVGKEIEEAIDYQVRSMLPLLPSGVETDWEIIGRDVEGKVEVLLAAIPKSVVQSYMSAVTDIGLDVIAIEPAVFANIRIIKPALLKQKDQLLVYMGDNFAEFTYLTNGNPRFSDFLTSEEIAKKEGITNSIRDYVIFSNSKHPNRPISEIVISGFSDQIGALVNNFRSQGVAATLATSRLSGSRLADRGLLHTAHGLSLKPSVTTNLFNLLPLEHRLAMLRNKLLGRWRLVLDTLIVLTLLISGGLFYVYRTSLESHNVTANLDGEYRREFELPANKQLIDSSRELNLLSDQLIRLRESTGGESNLFYELSATTPTGITLTSLVYARGSGSVRLADQNSNWALTGTAISRQEVLDFYNKLISLADFSNGKLYLGSLEKGTSITFRIANQAK